MRKSVEMNVNEDESEIDVDGWMVIMFNAKMSGPLGTLRSCRQ